MDAIGQLLSFLWDAAGAMLDALGRAAVEHPLVTLLCYAAAALLFLRRHGRLADLRAGALLQRMHALDWIEALAFFIVTTLVARAVGVVVNAALDLLVWAVGALARLASVGADVTGEVASPFREAPVTYLLTLALTLLAATAWLRWRSWRERRRSIIGRTLPRRGVAAEWLTWRGLAAGAACVAITYSAATVAATIEAGRAPVPVSAPAQAPSTEAETR